MEMNETLTLAAVDRARRASRCSTIPSETVIATITPPTLEPVEDEIETETELVGEDGEAAEAAGGAATGRGRRRRAAGDDASE